MRTELKIDPRLKIDKLDDVIERPEIIRLTDFDSKDLEDFEEDIDDAHNTGQPIIPIIVDTYGGNAYNLLGMISAIENSSLPIATICTSKAMSAGAILFCFGTDGYRFMDPNAILMFHDAASFTGGKIEDIKADTLHLDQLNQTMYKRVAKHLGHKDSYLLDLIKKEHNHVDWYMGSREAKKHKIANHLRVPKFEVELSLDIKFG
jgi:ATP-dependent protease ClpP protease subunit